MSNTTEMLAAIRAIRALDPTISEADADAIASEMPRDLDVSDCESIDGEPGLLQGGWYADDGNAEVYYPHAESGEEAAEEYVTGGQWGDDAHGSVEVKVWQMAYTPEGAQQVNVETHSIDIPQEDSRLIRDAVGRYGLDDICGDAPEDHEWSREGEGGCDQNPGVWGTGGTSLLIHEHCTHCGLRRHTHISGSQRNPGDAAEWVEYLAPRSDD